MTDKQIIIDDCIHLDEWKHCDICEKLIKTKHGANGKKREHLLTEEDLRCDFYPNCYYKQLKHKEQECEELKDELLATKCMITTQGMQYGRLHEQLVQLKAENKELKKQLESTKGLVTVGNKQLVEALEGYNDLKNELHSKVDFIQEQRNVIDEYSKEIEMYKKCQGSRASKREEKLKQTLAEIKEIAEAQQSWNEWNRQFSETESEDDIFGYNWSALKLILQKINGVEDAFTL